MACLRRHVQGAHVTRYMTTATAHAQRGSPRDVTSGADKQLNDVTVLLLHGKEDGRH